MRELRYEDMPNVEKRLFAKICDNFIKSINGVNFLNVNDYFLDEEYLKILKSFAKVLENEDTPAYMYYLKEMEKYEKEHKVVYSGEKMEIINNSLEIIRTAINDILTILEEEDYEQ